MTNHQAIGKRLRLLRKRARATPKLTQEEVADAVGISRSALAGAESGGDKLGLDSIVAVADYYKVPLDWLLCRKPPPGGPLVGKFVEDPDKLALLAFWDSLTVEDRTSATRLLRIPGLQEAG